MSKKLCVSYSYKCLFWTMHFLIFHTCVHKCPRVSQWNMTSNHLDIICWICFCFILVDKITLYLYISNFCLHLKFMRVPITYTHAWKYFKSISYKFKIYYGLLYTFMFTGKYEHIFIQIVTFLFIDVKCIYASCSFFTIFFFILENFCMYKRIYGHSHCSVSPYSNPPMWVLHLI